MSIVKLLLFLPIYIPTLTIGVILMLVCVVLEFIFSIPYHLSKLGFKGLKIVCEKFTNWMKP